MPYSTLAAGILVVPTKDITISSTIMNTVDSSTTTGFSDFGDGWTWATEANVQYRLGKLPGGQNVSFVYAGDQDFFKIGGRYVLQPGEGIVPPSQDYSWAFTWSGWQYLYTAEEHDGPVNLDDGPPDLQGFGLFARAGWADGDTNPVRWSVSGGLGGRGIIPGRDRDLFGIGYYYISFESSRLTDASLIEDRSQGLRGVLQPHDHARDPAHLRPAGHRLLSPQRGYRGRSRHAAVPEFLITRDELASGSRNDSIMSRRQLFTMRIVLALTVGAPTCRSATAQAAGVRGDEIAEVRRSPRRPISTASR